MFRDYENAVVAYYKARKANQTLPRLLSKPTPAGLRKQCIMVCQERYNKTDDLRLREFFEHGGDKSAFLQAISRYDIDKFRPLINFLSGRSGTTAEINIELLAWLLDFQPRPYNEHYDYVDPEMLEVKEDEKMVVEDDGGEMEEESSSVEDEPAVRVAELTKRGFNFSLWKSAAVITLLAAATLGIRYYSGRVTKPQGPLSGGHQVYPGPEACMFWNGDHYDTISCKQKLEGTLVVALDPEKVSHFRMITRPDTITEQSVRKVWYAKHNRKVEFFTGDGFHPVDPQLRLKPATDYMIRKYCLSGALSSTSVY